MVQNLCQGVYFKMLVFTILEDKFLFLFYKGFFICPPLLILVFLYQAFPIQYNIWYIFCNQYLLNKHPVCSLSSQKPHTAQTDQQTIDVFSNFWSSKYFHNWTTFITNSYNYMLYQSAFSQRFEDILCRGNNNLQRVLGNGW